MPIKDTHGFKDASPNRAQIAVWSKLYPHANIAVATGEVSRIIVIDLDPRSGSEELIRRLAAQGKHFPETVMSVTPRGGNHLYFAFDDRVLVSRTNALARPSPAST